MEYQQIGISISSSRKHIHKCCYPLSRSQLNIYSSRFFLRHNFSTFFVSFSSVTFRLNTAKTDGCTKLTLLESFTEVRPTPEGKLEPMQRNSLAANSSTRSATDGADTRLAVHG